MVAQFDVKARTDSDLASFCKYPYINGDEADFEKSLILDVASKEHFSAVADADFAEWSQVPLWTVEQATSLFFGKDPEFFLWEPVSRYAALHSRIKRCSLMRKRLVSEVFKSDLAVNYTSILSWSKDKGFTFPSELYALVDTEEAERERAKGEDDFWQSLEPRQKNTLKKLIMVMAVSRFGYNPIEDRFKGLSEMDRVSRAIFGSPMDDEAVRYILRKLESRVDLNREGVEMILREMRGGPVKSHAAKKMRST